VKSVAPASSAQKPSTGKKEVSPAKKTTKTEVKVEAREVLPRRAAAVKSESPSKSKPKRSESAKKSVSPAKVIIKAAPVKPVIKEEFKKPEVKVTAVKSQVKQEKPEEEAKPLPVAAKKPEPVRKMSAPAVKSATK